MTSINLPVTFFYTSYYWENIIDLAPPQKQEDGTYNLVYPLDNVPLPGLTTVDIGRAVVALIEKGLGEPGEFFGLASDHLLISEMANILSEVSGEHVKSVSLDPQLLREKGDTVSVMLANVFQYKHEHNKEYCEVRALIKPTSFQDFCKENLALIFKV
ncbi:Nucleoside-diphosphate sugar epimerase [Oopsacas minuta]|uniref:NmrA-like family domain-containing protein 1 n=1 Tax=Oopsacas minuta TaxID=111878 RepID=A0AAV7JJ51_9METZ|nr:Nucleoside-diphosphate sugar epimerase [Oopsacas minuta]